MIKKKNNIEFDLFKVKDVQKSVIDYKDIEINPSKESFDIEGKCLGVLRNYN